MKLAALKTALDRVTLPPGNTTTFDANTEIVSISANLTGNVELFAEVIETSPGVRGVAILSRQPVVNPND